MADIIGTEAGEQVLGTTGDDSFAMEQGGDDIVSAGAGDDTISFGEAFDLGDRVDGGDGFDTLVFYHHSWWHLDGMAFAADTMRNVERLTFVPGSIASIRLHDDNVAAGEVLEIVAPTSGGAWVDGSAETDASFVFTASTGALRGDGGAGADQLTGGVGLDVLAGGGGSDTIDGGDEGDILFSADHGDTMYLPDFYVPGYFGDFPEFVLDSGTAHDTLAGGAGDDRLFAGYGDDVDGGADDSQGDWLYVSFLGATTGVAADFRLASQVIGGGTITGIESVVLVEGSEFADTIRMPDQSVYANIGAVFGRGGDDQLTAGFFTAYLDGGDGNDLVDGRGSARLYAVAGGAGDDTLHGFNGSAAVGGEGNDTIYAEAYVHGDDGDDTIHMSDSVFPDASSVYGDAGNDTIHGAQTANRISGGLGADVIHGGPSADVLVSELFGMWIVGNGHIIWETNRGTDDAGAEHDHIEAYDGDDAVWAGFGDYADGGTGYDTLSVSLAGSPGPVTITTGDLVAGPPYGLSAGTFLNFEVFGSLHGSEFDDSLTVSTQVSRVFVEAGAGNDQIRALDSAVSAGGGAGDDRFYSGTANDHFDGGAGRDTADYMFAVAGVTVQLNDLFYSESTGSASDGDTLANVEDISGSIYDDVLTGNEVANVLAGSSGDDVLDGQEGNDVLDGGAGTDTMAGGSGDDTYYIDGAGDLIVEAAGEGFDRVIATASFELDAASQVEVMQFADLAGTAALYLYGSAIANTLYGNAGANVLAGFGGDDYVVGFAGNDTLYGQEGNDAIEGGAGHDVLLGGDGADYLVGGEGDDLIHGEAGLDTLVGGLGDDAYYVDGIGDLIVEAAGEGFDRVIATGSFELDAASQVEVMQFADLAGTAALHLYGSAIANTLYGNAGANVLAGFGGDDYLVGFAGNDTLYGGAGNDAIEGGAGQDVLYGGAGADYLVGGADGDHFVFFEAPGSGGADTIADMTVGSDLIVLDDAVFAGLGVGALAASAFVAGTAAADAGDRVIYDGNSGQLWFDADGSGAGAAVLFAAVTPGTALTSADFLVV